MSRRKQANPKSLKLCIDALVEEQNKNITSTTTTVTPVEVVQAKLKENSDDDESDDSSDSVDQNQENKNVFIEKKEDEAEIRLVGQKDDDCFFKNRTNNHINIENRKLNLKYSDEEIDVENLSGDENGASSNESTVTSRSRSASNSSVNSSKSFDSSETKLVNQTSLELQSNSHGQSNKKRRQRYSNISNTVSLNTNTSSIIQKQQSNSSILINGKRYYPLKFSCENCGLRYSDQSTLNTHKQNYCSKRNQVSRSSRSASSSSSRSASSSRSNSPNQSKQLNFNIQTHKINTYESDQTKAIETMTKSDITTISKINNTSLIKIDNKNEINASVQNKEVHLLKSIMYQCNYCLFQTDKKSAMNKHSRVHLPQKRKEMEEMVASASSSNSISSSNLEEQRLADKTLNDKLDQKKYTHNGQDQIKQQNLADLNDKTKSYCSDCDIQFSSMKTFLHHRNNYCQKFKTIEAIVPVELSANKPIITSDKLNPVLQIQTQTQQSVNEKIKLVNNKPKEQMITQQTFKPKQNESALDSNPNEIKLLNKNENIQLIQAEGIKKPIDFGFGGQIISNEQSLNHIKTPTSFLTSNGEFLLQGNGLGSIKTKPTMPQKPSPVLNPLLVSTPTPTPPSAVRMGDLVYVPVYKLKNATDSTQISKISPLIEPIKNKLDLNSFYLNKLVNEEQLKVEENIRMSRSKNKDDFCRNDSRSSSHDSSKSLSLEAPLDLSIRNGLNEKHKFAPTSSFFSNKAALTQDQMNLFLSNAFNSNNNTNQLTTKHSSLLDINQLNNISLLASLNKSQTWTQNLKNKIFNDNEANRHNILDENSQESKINSTTELLYKSFIEQQNKAAILLRNNSHRLYDDGKSLAQTPTTQSLLKISYQTPPNMLEAQTHLQISNYIKQDMSFKQAQAKQMLTDSKIYHCTYCSQLFLKIKAFKRHQCVLNQVQAQTQVQAQDQQDQQPDNILIQNKTGLYDQLLLQQQKKQNESFKELVSRTKEVTVNNSPKRSKSRSPSSGSSSSETSTNANFLDNKRMKIPSPSLLLDKETKISPRTSQQKLTIKATGGQSLNYQDLLKLPSVINTLMKTYDVSTEDELKEYLNQDDDVSLNLSDENIRKFSICTTCGYRGKTIRGVKQHGKSHLIEKEHFGIIEVKEKQFSLAYYSATDTDIQFNNAIKKPGPSFLMVPRDLIDSNINKSSNNKNGSNLDSNEEDSSDEENKLEDSEAGCKIPLLLLNDDKKLNEEDAPCSIKRTSEFIKANSDLNQQPLSKKARILEGHYNNQKKEQLQYESINNSNVNKKIDKSHTFCVKCNIQFQHINNYLAHKSNYCKDN